MKRVLLFVTLLGAALAALPATAQNAAEVAAAWGLLGTWATDCAAGPSREVSHLTFARAGGKLVHRRDFGDTRDEFPVLAVRAKPDGMLEVKLDLVSFGERRTVVFAKAGDGKKRAMANWNEKGEFSIRHGKFTGNGKSSPVQTRCATATN